MISVVSPESRPDVLDSTVLRASDVSDHDNDGNAFISSWPFSAYVGMPIRAWSHSQQKWFSDGFIDTLNVDGSISITYNGGKTQKTVFWDDDDIEHVEIDKVQMIIDLLDSFLDDFLDDFFG